MRKSIALIWVLGLVLWLPGLTFAQESVPELKQRILDLQNQGELGFRNFTLCSNIIGYGQYVAIPDNKVKVGSEVFFYYEPVNLFTNRQDNAYHIWYTQDIVLYTEDGQEIYRGNEALNFNYQTVSPVLDVFASNTLSLGNLPPGVYQFEAVMHDKLKKVDAGQKYTFEVVP